MRSNDEEIERLQRRLERERRARRQAEIIAERGMRELWEANAELRERVGARTAMLECSLRALQLTECARSGALDRLSAAATSGSIGTREDPDDGVAIVLSHVRSLLGTTTSAPTDASVTEIDPLDFADRLLERWQHPAARAGQLLSVEVAEGAHPVAGDWALVQAMADALLDGCLRHAVAGALGVTVNAGNDGVGFSIHDSGPQIDVQAVEAAKSRTGSWSGLGVAGERFALADALAQQGAAHWTVDSDDSGTITSVMVAAG